MNANRIRTGDSFFSGGCVWLAIMDEDVEAEQIWAVRDDNPDVDGMFHRDEIDFHC